MPPDERGSDPLLGLCKREKRGTSSSGHVGSFVPFFSHIFRLLLFLPLLSSLPFSFIFFFLRYSFFPKSVRVIILASELAQLPDDFWWIDVMASRRNHARVPRKKRTKRNKSSSYSASSFSRYFWHFQRPKGKEWGNFSRFWWWRGKPLIGKKKKNGNRIPFSSLLKKNILTTTKGHN